MTQVKTTEVEQSEKKVVDLIPEERLNEILNILLPYGYSFHNGEYTGVSPYIGSSTNVITIVANQPKAWGSVLSICMEHFTEDGNEDKNDCLGFYKGIMKMIAPELHSTDKVFTGKMNTLDFDWAPDEVQDNRFPAKVVCNN